MTVPQVVPNTRSFTEGSFPASTSVKRRTRVAPSEQSRGGTLGGLQYGVIYDQDQWVATEEVTGMYGEGDTPDDAYHDLAASLRELRGHLEHYEAQLTNSLSSQLALLRRR